MKKENKNKNRRVEKIIKSSFNVKSKITFDFPFKYTPNKALNQHLLNPIKPNTFATNIKIKHNDIEISIKPLKI